MKKYLGKKLIWVLVVTMLLQYLPFTTLAAQTTNNKNKISISNPFSNSKLYKALTIPDYAREYRQQRFAEIDYQSKVLQRKMFADIPRKNYTEGQKLYIKENIKARNSAVAVIGSFKKLPAYVITSVPLLKEQISKNSNKALSSIKLYIGNK